VAEGGIVLMHKEESESAGEEFWRTVCRSVLVRIIRERGGKERDEERG
jgi:hypothetical protein